MNKYNPARYKTTILQKECAVKPTSNYIIALLQLILAACSVNVFAKTPLHMPDLVEIPAGTYDLIFYKFSDEYSLTSYQSNLLEKEAVTIKPFKLGKTEVTFEQYDEFCESTGSPKPDDSGWGRGKRPVINVSLDDSLAYVKWLSEQTGMEYRLPKLFEMEYARRAGSTTKFSWGDEIGIDNSNYFGSKTQKTKYGTVPVGSFKSNPFGLFDMEGNVAEWTENICSENCSSAVQYGVTFMMPSDRGDERYHDGKKGSHGVGFRIAQGDSGIDAYLPRNGFSYNDYSYERKIRLSKKTAVKLPPAFTSIGAIKVSRIDLLRDLEFPKNILSSPPIAGQSIIPLCKILLNAKKDHYLHIKYIDDPQGDITANSIKDYTLKIDLATIRNLNCKKVIQNGIIVNNSGFTISGHETVGPLAISVNTDFFYINNSINIAPYMFVLGSNKTYYDWAMVADIYKAESTIGPVVKTTNVVVIKTANVAVIRATNGNSHLQEAIKQSDFTFNAAACGNMIGYAPTKKNRRVKLLKVGAHKQRGLKLNGIKYTPVLAEVSGQCINTIERISPTGRPLGMSNKKYKKPIRFTGTFKFVVFQNDFDEWIAKESI